MKCNETKFTDSNLHKASEVELESDKNALRTSVCFIYPFISAFLRVTNLLFQVDYSQWNQDHQQHLCSSLEFESRERKVLLFASLFLQIQEKAFDYSSWIIFTPG